MTVKKINDILSSTDNENDFTAVLYGVVTKFDLDGSARIVSRKWY